jgi:hypothetical protein
VDSFTDIAAALTPGKRITVGALDHRTGNTGEIFVKVK